MKKENQNITEIVFILDRSGSMHGLESDTIGGFNSMLDKQKKECSKAYVSTVLFSDKSEVLHDRLAIEDVKPLTSSEYSTYGCTALIDAIGGAIKHISNIHKYARPEDVPSNTIFIIITDGYENASYKYSSDIVKQMIEQKKNEYGWEFLFIGANIDAVNTAKSFGIDERRAVNYNADSEGTAIVYDNVCATLKCLRTEGAIEDDWAKEIALDHKSRRRK